MHHYYKDILDRISEEPKWFDEHAVPRYCDFHPSEVANIYADEVALVRIDCQSCNYQFKVAFSFGAWENIQAAGNPDNKEEFTRRWRAASLANDIRQNAIHYRDPPNIGCCAAGPTMNSVPIRVMEYWKRETFVWKRDSNLEVRLDEPL